MQIKIITPILIATVATCYSATVVTSETNPFTALGSQTDSVTVSSDGEVTFLNTQNQGSGIVLDPGTGASNPFTTTGSTYFNFSARVGGTPLEVFFGAVSSTPNSADGRNPNSTAFALGISETGVDTFSQGSATDIGLAGSPFTVGTKLNFEVVVTPTEQNPGQFFFDYDVVVTIDGTTTSASQTGIRANQNPATATSVADYTFNGIGTRNGSGSVQDNVLGPAIISDMPINIPEPSSSLLLGISMLTCCLIRRRR